MPFISSVRGNYGPQGRFGRALGLASSTGGTITTAGGYRIHTFLLADTGTNFVSSGSGTVEYLVIGGGGAGGEYGGGAGAGGYLTGTLAVSATSYPITVGEGFKHPSAGNYQLCIFICHCNWWWRWRFVGWTKQHWCSWRFWRRPRWSHWWRRRWCWRCWW
jgi:hypothetical protein